VATAGWWPVDLGSFKLGGCPPAAAASTLSRRTVGQRCPPALWGAHAPLFQVALLSGMVAAAARRPVATSPLVGDVACSVVAQRTVTPRTVAPRGESGLHTGRSAAPCRPRLGAAQVMGTYDDVLRIVSLSGTVRCPARHSPGCWHGPGSVLVLSSPSERTKQPQVARTAAQPGWPPGRTRGAH